MTTIDEKDRTRIRGFLVSPAGRSLLAWLREPEQRPKIRTNNVQPHDVQMDAGAQNGYDKAIQTIEKFMAELPQESFEEDAPKLRSTEARTTT